MATTEAWVALTTIWINDVRAFLPGDVVPDSIEANYDFSGQSLVERATITDDEKPPNGRPVAFEDEVVLRTQLVISPTAPANPAVGTVWIDNSTS